MVSARFADIFRGNAGKCGLVTAEVDHAVVEKIWEYLDAEPGTEVTVDLQEKKIRVGDIEADFVIDDYVRWRLLEGLDDIGITMQSDALIGEFEQQRPEVKPTTV